MVNMLSDSVHVNGKVTGKPPPKPERKMSWVLKPRLPDCPFGVLRLEVRRGSTDYFVRSIPCDIGGRGFEVVKLVKGRGEDGIYHVWVNGPTTSCDCPGFQRYGHCRHRDALRQLVSLGQL
jgi:hypothetical protein